MHSILPSQMVKVCPPISLNFTGMVIDAWPILRKTFPTQKNQVINRRRKRNWIFIVIIPILPFSSEKSRLNGIQGISQIIPNNIFTSDYLEMNRPGDLTESTGLTRLRNPIRSLVVLSTFWERGRRKGKRGKGEGDI